ELDRKAAGQRRHRPCEIAEGELGSAPGAGGGEQLAAKRGGPRVAVDPGDQETTIAEAHHVGNHLIPGGRAVDDNVVADEIAVRGGDPEPDRRAVAIAGAGPGDRIAAAAEAGHVAGAAAAETARDIGFAAGFGARRVETWAGTEAADWGQVTTKPPEARPAAEGSFPLGSAWPIASNSL